MTRPVVLLPGAEDEVEAAAHWHDEQLPGLGRRFLAAVDRAIAAISQRSSTGTPVPHTPMGMEIRQMPTPPFRYVVVYRVDQDLIVVVAVHHERRRPGYWSDRL